MKSRTIISIIALVVLVAAVSYFYCVKDATNTENPINATSTPVVVNTIKGVVTKNQDGTNQYTNEVYKLTFNFTSKWHIGSDDLSNGTLQLFNYDENIYRKGFGSGENKIEARIGIENTYQISSDYPEKSRTTKQIMVTGQNTNVLDIELESGEKMRTYFIPLTSMSGKYFIVTIYGDYSNFVELDNLVKSFQSTK